MYGSGGNRVPQWRKSRHSEQDYCVEVARLVTGVGVRDSKDAWSPVIVVPVGAWAMLAGRLG
ncbi:DUF397 domain-containing protein [Embleya scabrispora]|uniref:DUF397 domain-containing protein n=1 Tax=Embleya scabrispora TaxID=159449 RepID=UPI000C7D8D44|nr:DUF397 domain-containing protein [Embleya scabrispora]